MNRKHQRGPSLIERALIAKEWHASTVDAQIHALIGEDSDEMVNAAGRILFVVLGAAIADGLQADHVEIRIIRGAVNAVHDQAGEADIPDARRNGIVSGLQAATRLIPELRQKSIVASAIDLHVKLRRQHIRLSDFQALIPESKSTQGAAA
jgi:hypothetical protein